MTKNLEGDPADIAEELSALRNDVSHLTEEVGRLRAHVEAAALPALRVPPVSGVNAPGEAKNRPKLLRWVARGEVEASIERPAVTGLIVAIGVGLFLGVLVRPRR